MGGFADIGSELGSAFGDLPVVGTFIDSPSQKARKEQLQTMADVANAYQAYRPQYQQAQQQAMQNMAGLMGPLNQMVMKNTGQQLDFDAAMQPVVSNQMMGVGAPQAPGPDPYEKTGKKAVGGAMVGTGAGAMAGGDLLGGGALILGGNEIGGFF